MDYCGKLQKLWAAVSFLMLPAAFSQAATIHVPFDQPSIQAGIDAASEGDTVLVAPGTYQGSGNLNINFGGKDLALIGEKGPELTIISACNAFYFCSGESTAALLQGFTIHAGLDFGGCLRIENGSSPTLRELIVERGELFLSSRGAGSDPRIFDSVFRNHACYDFGQTPVRIYYDSNPVFTNVVFENNEAYLVGAVKISDSSPRFLHCVFRANTAPRFQEIQGDTWYCGKGGAVSCIEEGSPVFEDCLFQNNLAEGTFGDPWYPNPKSGKGGAVYIGSSTPIFKRCTFAENKAQTIYGIAQGGGIYCAGTAAPILEQVIIAFSEEGGGIYCHDPTCAPVLSCCDIFGNVDGDFLGYMEDPSGSNGNFSLDPQFCGIPGSGNCYLQSDSPCAPGNHPDAVDCELIGALPVGCEETATEKRSMSELKALFR